MDTVEHLIAVLTREIINPLIALLFAIALVLFIVGVVRYLLNGDSDEARQTGTRHIIYGIIGMTVMAGVYGILAFIQGTLNGIF
jgi:hypothetical protein